MIAAGYIPASVFDRAPSPEAARAIWGGIEVLPAAFRVPLLDGYERKGSIEYLANAVCDLSGTSLALSASDGEICDYARERANEVRSMLMATTATTAKDMMCLLAGYCAEFGAQVPGKVPLAGLCARMTDAGWWRRQVRRSMARKVEKHAIGLGMVHRRAGLYASDGAVKRHAEQCARNAAALAETEATNEEGLTMTLAELAAVDVSNPRIRRGELMTRIAGFEAFAKAAGHVGMFYTATAPSRMHPRMAATGQENPKFDGTTPKECAGYLSKTWAKARAWLHRRGITIYGFRVAEPHHDGTPHWHMLFFMLAEVVESVTHCLRRYFCEADAAELSSPKAAKARFEAVRIDWKRGSAAGYISKYIAKNIDGSKNDLSSIGQAHDETEDGTYEVGAANETAPRVLAWASTWGIRQFQQIGGPGVTVWRELRRVRDMQGQGDLFDTWTAADVGNWEEFTRRQGGVDCRRDERPVQLWREEPEEYIDMHGEIRKPANKYGEEVGPVIKGVCIERPTVGESFLMTKVHSWEIRRGRNVRDKALVAGAGCSSEAIQEVRKMRGNERTYGGAVLPVPEAVLTLGAERPWSPVNNCTPAKDADGHAIGEFAGWAPAEVSAADLARVKRAHVAAVLAGIESRRKRGAFGQFPRLKNA